MPEIVVLETRKQFAAKCLKIADYYQAVSLDNLLAACKRRGYVPVVVYSFHSRAGFDWYVTAKE